MSEAGAPFRRIRILPVRLPPLPEPSPFLAKAMPQPLTTPPRTSPHIALRRIFRTVRTRWSALSVILYRSMCCLIDIFDTALPRDPDQPKVLWQSPFNLGSIGVSPLVTCNLQWTLKHESRFCLNTQGFCSSDRYRFSNGLFLFSPRFCNLFTAHCKYPAILA